jgi:type VI protein secretion system component Hcp
VTLDMLRPGGSNLPYLQIKLTDAIIVSEQIGGAGDSQPTESVSFDYRRVELKYTAVDGSTVQTRLEQLGR